MIVSDLQSHCNCRRAWSRPRGRVHFAFPVGLALILVQVSTTEIRAREGAAALKPLLLERPADLPPSRFPFRSYGAELGLSNLAVRRIAQDTTGFLWVGTEDGLYRYDGNRFARFDLHSGLPSTWINDILATPEGALWVCTLQGLAAGRGERFRVFRPETSGLPAGGCNALARDASGNVWVAHSRGLFYKDADKFKRLEGWPAGDASAIISLPAPSTELVASGGGRVFRVHRNHAAGGQALAPGWVEPVDSLACDSSGAIWAQSARRIFHLAPGAAAFTDESSALPPVSSRGVLSTDRSGRLWVPTDEGASCRVAQGWRHFGPAEGLPTDWTRYIFEDREGSLWIGSLAVHRLVGQGSWTSWTRAEGLPSDTIWDVHRSRTGQLWVATDKGLCLATRQGWRVLSGTERTVVRRIYEDREGRLWMGLAPSAILRYDPVSRRLVRFGSSQGVAGRRLLCLENDGTGQLWAATDGAGLLRFRPERGDFVREEVPFGTPQETFRFLLRDSRGRLWATGEHGLLLRSGGRWRRFTRQDGLLKDHVSYLAETRSGDIWLSYFEPLGLVRLRVADDRPVVVEHVDSSRGLSSQKIYLLAEDQSGRLWVGTGEGVDVLSGDRVLHFSKGDGLAGDDIDAMAILVESDGSIFIGTSSGLSLYRNGPSQDGIHIPRPVLINAHLGDVALPPGEGPARTVDHNQNELKIQYAVLSFLHEDQIENEHRLRGVDSDWQRSPFREARYPGLPQGSYVFEVRSRQGSGVWSEPASLAFNIRPPWWRTWPALAGYLLLASLTIVAGFRWRLRRLQARTLVLENLVAARTHELAVANASLERLSITDPLTGLKNRRFLEFSIAEDLARAKRSIEEAKTDLAGDGPSDSAGIAFLLIDLDHFKHINDNCGHAAGDQALQQVSRILCAAVRESDTVVRWGGEEFLAVAAQTRWTDTQVLAERIRSHIESASFNLGNGSNSHFSCSIGFSLWPLFPSDPDAVGWQDVVELADRCLYAAKNSGRNAWVGVRVNPAFDGGDATAALEDLQRAIERGIAEVKCRLSGNSVLRWQ